MRFGHQGKVATALLKLIVFLECATAIIGQSVVVFDAPSASWYTGAKSINDGGDVTGVFYDSSNMLHSFVRTRDGQISSFDAPNGSFTGSYGINSKGDIGGNYHDSSLGRGRGFIRDWHANFIVFDVPTALEPNILGINNNGDVTGTSNDASLGATRGFVRNWDGSSIVFDAPNARATMPMSINDSGDITGVFVIREPGGDTTHAFLRHSDGQLIVFDAAAYSNNNGDITGFLGNNGKDSGFLRDRGGNLTIFDAPNSSQTIALSINDSGDVTGYLYDVNLHRTRGFVRNRDGTVTVFDPPNSWYTYPTSINNSGDVTGEFGDANYGYKVRSFVRISDTTPPVIYGMPASGCTLWPANGKMVRIATITATDALSGLAAGSFKVTGTSNEPSDLNNPDVVITPNASGGYDVQLRADRLGSRAGRVYTLNATATDLAGNTATVTATCTVPHDQASR